MNSIHNNKFSIMDNNKQPLSFVDDKQMIDFISQHNAVLERYHRKINAQDAIIDVLRENIRDLIKVVNSQNQVTDLTDKLMEEDFPIFQKLLDADLGGKF